MSSAEKEDAISQFLSGVAQAAREAAEKVMAKDATLNRWLLLKAELQYRHQRLMGGTILT